MQIHLNQKLTMKMISMIFLKLYGLSKQMISFFEQVENPVIFDNSEYMRDLALNGCFPLQ